MNIKPYPEATINLLAKKTMELLTKVEIIAKYGKEKFDQYKYDELQAERQKHLSEIRNLDKQIQQLRDDSIQYLSCELENGEKAFVMVGVTSEWSSYATAELRKITKAGEMSKVNTNIGYLKLRII